MTASQLRDPRTLPSSNRDSSAIRASVLDVCRQLGALDQNSLVADWMFNESSAEDGGRGRGPQVKFSREAIVKEKNEDGIDFPQTQGQTSPSRKPARFAGNFFFKSRSKSRTKHGYRSEEAKQAEPGHDGQSPKRKTLAHSLFKHRSKPVGMSKSMQENDFPTSQIVEARRDSLYDEWVELARPGTPQALGNNVFLGTPGPRRPRRFSFLSVPRTTRRTTNNGPAGRAVSMSAPASPSAKHKAFEALRGASRRLSFSKDSLTFPLLSVNKALRRNSAEPQSRTMPPSSFNAPESAIPHGSTVSLPDLIISPPLTRTVSLDHFPPSHPPRGRGTPFPVKPITINRILSSSAIETGSKFREDI